MGVEAIDFRGLIFAATGLVEGLLWGVAAADPLALGVGVVVLLVAVASAIWVPLQRALRLDAVASLRVE